MINTIYLESISFIICSLKVWTIIIFQKRLSFYNVPLFFKACIFCIVVQKCPYCGIQNIFVKMSSNDNKIYTLNVLSILRICSFNILMLVLREKIKRKEHSFCNIVIPLSGKNSLHINSWIQFRLKPTFLGKYTCFLIIMVGKNLH